MTRKQFFGLLGGAGAATAVASAAVTSPVRPAISVAPDTFERSGWKFRWTGFKGNASGLFEVGQWLAARVDPIGGEGDFRHRNIAYWCTTGCGDWYNQGDHFNLCLTNSGHKIDIDSTHKQREGARIWALLRLIEFLEIEGGMENHMSGFEHYDEV